MSVVVSLRNNSEELESVVNVTMLSLQRLFAANPIAAYELRELCRDRRHKLFGNTDRPLKSLGLVGPTGDVHSSIRNVVLSAFVGEGLEMILQSPIRPAETTTVPTTASPPAGMDA